jgi:biopolymer transport protein TolQ
MLFAANAAVYAIQNATTEGKITVIVLLVLSLFSWTIIITKFRQLSIARKATKKVFRRLHSTRDPLDIQRKGEEFDGAPAYQLYIRGADELAYQLKNNPVQVQAVAPVHPPVSDGKHRSSGALGHHQNQHGLV